jgi:G6PDH family F420-dependent oxidoreductase
VMSGGRFTLGLGAGERLNEHVVGAGWPGVVERHERLGEALDIIQGLLAGKITTYRGRHLNLEHAKLFDRPARKPAVVLAAGGPEAARLAAEKADGLVVTEAKKEIVQAWRKAGGKGPLIAEIALCCGRDEKAAIKTAHKYFRWSVAGWPVLAELPHEEAFEAASKHVSPDVVAEEISCGPDAARHLKAIGKYVALGCDHIVLNQIGPDQDFFFKFFSEKLAPSLLRRRRSARR